MFIVFENHQLTGIRKTYERARELQKGLASFCYHPMNSMIIEVEFLEELYNVCLSQEEICHGVIV